MRASAATGAPALETTWPSTETWPARISARARSRVGARPRSTSARSRRFLAGKSVLARDDPLRDRREVTGRQLRIGEGLARARCAVRGERPRCVETEHRGIRRLGARRVLSRGLAQFGGAAFAGGDGVDDF